MLDQFPPEIIEQILGNLPTVSSTVNVDCTNRKLHAIVSENDHAIFRGYLQKTFPSISTPPLWREMTCALTSRSRAWSRRAFIARECAPPPDDTQTSERIQQWQKFGYIPVIDSYESWPESKKRERREVLAWGAAGRLRMRIKTKKEVFWSSLRGADDHVPQNDILDVRLLRQHQNRNSHGESILLRRANGEISMFNTMPEPDNFAHVSRYISNSMYIDCMDISESSEPLLAICNTRSLQLFPVHTDQEKKRASDVVAFSQHLDNKHRKRCVRFLSKNTIAVGIQYVEGRSRAPIQVFDVSPEGLSRKPLHAKETISADEAGPQGRYSANVIATLDGTFHTAYTSGQSFLSGWTDGIVRVHDGRTPSGSVSEYLDPVDDGQILSLVPYGHECFLAGSHQNACLKIFDMRVTTKTLSKVDLNVQTNHTVGSHSLPSENRPNGNQRRDFNIFLAVTINQNSRPWQLLPSRQNHTLRLPRYRGSVYSLSSPSPSSATVYAGIENHVIQLDFQNTDDLKSNRGGMFGGVLDDREILNLSCYERPRPGHESTDPVLLRKQISWASSGSSSGKSEEGWDERWRLPSPSDRGNSAGVRWRRGSNRNR